MKAKLVGFGIVLLILLGQSNALSACEPGSGMVQMRCESGIVRISDGQTYCSYWCRTCWLEDCDGNYISEIGSDCDQISCGSV